MNERIRRPTTGTLLISTSDLARELQVSAKTITRMDQSGKLPRPVRIGRSKRWVIQTIVDWIEAGTPNRREWEARQS